MTGLETTENQARRLLGDIRAFGTELQQQRAAESARTGVPLRALPENVVAVRWLDQRFEPLIAQIPPALHSKLEAAEIFHQLLEHRWFLSETANVDISLEEALNSYIADVLADAPDELLYLGEVTAEIPVIAAEPPPFRILAPSGIRLRRGARFPNLRDPAAATLSSHERNLEHRRP